MYPNAKSGDSLLAQPSLTVSSGAFFMYSFNFAICLYTFGGYHIFILITKIDQMSNKKPKIRLYINAELKVGTVHLVDAQQGHYLANVMRVRVTEYIILFNGNAGEWLAEITKVGKGKVNVTVRELVREQTNEPDLWYLFSPVKKARVDYMIQKATELGVSLIAPVVTKRTNLDRIKHDKLVVNAVEAAEQCGRMTVPEVKQMSSLEAALKNWPADRELIFCDEAGDAILMGEVSSPYKKWAVLIGPEGGFTVDERKMIRDHKNTVAVTLGPRILRADTAAVVSLSLWQTYLGDWSNE